MVGFEFTYFCSCYVKHIISEENYLEVPVCSDVFLVSVDVLEVGTFEVVVVLGDFVVVVVVVISRYQKYEYDAFLKVKQRIQNNYDEVFPSIFL